MKRLNPDKLFVEYRDSVSEAEPVIGRRYTLTHSDETAELFLTVGRSFALEKITSMRDEVLGEWRMQQGTPFLHVYVSVDGQTGTLMSAFRNSIFRRELPLALEAIVFGDRKLYLSLLQLEQAPIYIHFDSILPYYNKYEYWGITKNYMDTAQLKK